jgi:hypothetical protein
MQQYAFQNLVPSFEPLPSTVVPGNETNESIVEFTPTPTPDVTEEVEENKVVNQASSGSDNTPTEYCFVMSNARWNIGHKQQYKSNKGHQATSQMMILECLIINIFKNPLL